MLTRAEKRKFFRRTLLQPLSTKDFKPLQRDMKVEWNFHWPSDPLRRASMHELASQLGQGPFIITGVRKNRSKKGWPHLVTLRTLRGRVIRAHRQDSQPVQLAAYFFKQVSA